MSKFVDVYLLPLAESKLEAYRDLAQKCSAYFLKYGATRYREYAAADMNAPDLVAFPQIVKLEPGETLIYAAVEYDSEERRNEAMKAIMNDTEMAKLCGEEPLFDFHRMVYGGFSILVDE